MQPDGFPGEHRCWAHPGGLGHRVRVAPELGLCPGRGASPQHSCGPAPDGALPPAPPSEPEGGLSAGADPLLLSRPPGLWPVSPHWAQGPLSSRVFICVGAGALPSQNCPPDRVPASLLPPGGSPPDPPPPAEGLPSLPRPTVFPGLEVWRALAHVGEGLCRRWSNLSRCLALIQLLCVITELFWQL